MECECQLYIYTARISADTVPSAGMFWLHDSYYDGDGVRTWKKKWTGTLSAVLTIVAGLFICVAGLYVTIRAIVDAYADGTITAPFSC